jgi:ribose transport system substrate-binding protein
MSIHEEGRRMRWRAPVALVAALALVAAALLSACGSSNKSSSTKSSSSSSSASTAAKPPWCGSKSITLGIQDGGGLNDWSKAALGQVKAEAALCPSIKKEIVVNAGFDPQKAVSGFRGAVAQGANAIVIIPDSGVCAELPAIRQATQRKVAVVPWGANPCGKPGVDFKTYVDFDNVFAGRQWATWMAKQLKGKGNLIWLGGPAGNPVDAGEIKGTYEVLKQYPGIKVLGNVSEKNFPVTNWDPAQATKVSSALLAKYPKIDGIISSYGSVSQAAVKVFQAAHRPVPAIATLEQNALACSYTDLKGKKGAFALATISNRHWLGRIAVRKAVAAVNGLSEPGKSTVDLPLFEDSTNPSLQPTCDKSAPDETFHSNDGNNPQTQIASLVYGGQEPAGDK